MRVRSFFRTFRATWEGDAVDPPPEVGRILIWSAERSPRDLLEASSASGLGADLVAEVVDGILQPVRIVRNICGWDSSGRLHCSLSFMVDS